MQYEVSIPSLGEEEGDRIVVALWLAREGDAVEEGGDLLELTTDKAAFTLPCPKAGTLVRQLVREEDEVRVGDAVGVLEV